MGELARCFRCGWAFGRTEPVPAAYRTAEPEWRQAVLCGPCANRLRGCGGVLIYRGDEWVTVRVLNGDMQVEEGEDLDVQS